MQRALSQYLEGEGADLREAANSLAQLDRGEGTDLDDVLEKAESIVAAAEARRAARVG